MHIIFENVTVRSYPIIKVLRFLRLDVFYLNIKAKTKFKRVSFSEKLKKNNVLPLPIEEQKEIPYEIYYETEFDKNETIFKKNKLLISEKILNKFCHLFSINETNNMELRLFSQDVLFAKTSYLCASMKIWRKLNPNTKIIFISFNFWNFYFIDHITNFKKIILPLNFLNFLNKILIFLYEKLFEKKINSENKTKHENFRESIKEKKVALFVHKGLTAGDNLYEKNLYYSEKKDSAFNINNILHLDYDNYDSPKKNILWLNLKKLNFSKKKIFFKLFIAFFNSFYFVTSWRNFLAWCLLMKQYLSYIIYLERIDKFKNLKLALIDYDHLCPKGLIFALKKKNIKIIATQERFLGGLFSSFYNVIADTYFTCSDYMNERIKNSKYFQVKNLVPVGQYRSDYLSLYDNKNIPKEILLQRKTGRKIIVALGMSLNQVNWFESNVLININCKAQKNFIDDMIKLSQDMENIFLILRFRNFIWKSLPYFQDTLKKIKEIKNIYIADDYSEYLNSYKYCANADLIISNFTSLADECLAYGKPLIFFDYTHNLKKIISGTPGYLITQKKEIKNLDVFCHDYNEILDKSKIMLSNNFNQLKQESKEKIDQFYYLKEKGLVKEKILHYLEANF